MKRLKLFIVTAAMIMSASITSFAGQWNRNDKGWWYQNDDKTYLKSTWFEYNGKWYYFNAEGYMLENTTTPDGYKVDANGAYIKEVVNNTTSTSTSNTKATNSAKSSSKDSSVISYAPYDGYTIIVNTRTKKYHYPTCKSVKKMADRNMGYADDASALEAMGYSACKNCH